MSDKLSGLAGEVFACLGQRFEVGELVRTSRFTCEDAQPIMGT
jgi:hypothetical protein